MLIYAAAAGLSYLLGSIPFGLILMKVLRGTDIRSSGSGNIGAANVARVAPRLGALTLALDAAKGYASVYLAGQLYSWLGTRSANPAQGSAVILGIAALFAILGHMFPVWLKFKGGKGVATAMGAFLGIAPVAVLVVLVLFFIIFALWSYSSLASITCAAIFPFVAYFALPRAEFWQLLPMVATSSLLIIAKHHQNIQRLLSGTEHRLELKRR